MGLRLGFQHPSGFDLANAAGPGEEGYFMNLRPKPRPGLPFRAVVRSPCAQAVFESIDDARLYLDHPGEVPAFAAHYIEWAEQEQNR